MTGSDDMTTAEEEDIDMQDDPTDRYDASRWLRKRVGVVAARDLPADPSEEDFRQGLRSGVALCIALNKIKSGSVPKIVKAPSALISSPDAEAQAAYVENVKSFLTAVEEMGLPTFEQVDLEQEGDFSCVVDCILAMKAYSETGASDFTWTPRPSRSRKTFIRNNSAPAMSRLGGANLEKLWVSVDPFGADDLDEECDSGPLYPVVTDLLEDREEEDIPIIVENILHKVKEEFETRLGCPTEDEDALPVTEAPTFVIMTHNIISKIILNYEKEEDEETEEEKAAKEQARINREKELLALKEAKRKEDEEKAAKERERVQKEKELRAAQEKARKEEEERIRKEKELLAEQERARKEEEKRIRREQELLAEQERLRKEEEERLRREAELRAELERLRKEEEERLRREAELRAEQERLRKEEEERLERLRREEEERLERLRKEEEERIRKEQELLEEQKRLRKEEKERIKREKQLLKQQEKERRREERRIKKEQEALARKEKARKEKEERIQKEKLLLAQQEKERRLEEQRKRREQREFEKQEKARKREEERIRRENLSLAQKEKAQEEQERIKKEIELLVQQEKAKEDEIAAIELEGVNKEKALLEEEEKAKKEEEEQELLEIEKEKEQAQKREEYRRRMAEYNRLNVNTPKQCELVGQQDKHFQGLRSTISNAKTDVQSMQINCQEEADNLGTHMHTICQAAAGYKKGLEENRKLYNQVQDLKGNIRVYCRIRPFLPGQENKVTSVDYTDDETVAIIVPKGGREGRKASMFNKVFGPSSTQEEVFSDTQPLIRSVLDGFNVCVLACGQTGVGKTYTLSGPEEITQETMGVNLRALNDLFLISEERNNLMSYEISINMLEIYNDEVRDLLVADGSSKSLDIVYPAKKGISVPEATLVPVSSTDDVINLMKTCKKNRSLNDHSSRAHTFLTAHVVGKDLTAGTTTRGCLHLVDLAGSEKLDSEDEEAAHINKSISALGDVLVALANKSNKVTYKTCKLTQLLQEAIATQAKILIFVHVHPDIEEALETWNTFKFVERFSTVEGGAGKSPEVRELKEQICLLKSALAKKEAGDPQWQDMLNEGGDQNGGGDDDDDGSKAKSKQPAKSAAAPAKKAAAAPAKKAAASPAKKGAKK
ncbi:kinesin-like protein KIN-14Q [Bidens hawaiensis]|uniref:kinesin-like protein KIN-14Q n=1 Tax=Bidens hawaiensis TaxID=980011 RepID=UPI004049E6F9